MNHPAAISDNDLHALLDGALDASRAREVMAEVEADPAMATRLAAFRADKDMLKQIYGPLAAQPVPEEWLKLAQSRRPRPALSWRMVGSIAAVLLVAAAVGYAALLPSARPSEIVQAALDARQAEGGQTIAVAANGNAGRYADTLSKTVDVPVKVPDLSKMGYHLAAIRLYPKAPGGDGAELLYRDSENRLFTLYLRHSDGSVRFDQFESAGLRVCIWQDDRLGMVMAGNVSTAAMQRLASLAYTGLTL